MTPEIAEGWKEIADVIRVSVRAAQERADNRNAKWRSDPLPVRYGHRGVWAFASALREWVHRWDMAYQVHQRLRAVASSCAATSSDGDNADE